MAMKTYMVAVQTIPYRHKYIFICIRETNLCVSKIQWGGGGGGVLYTIFQLGRQNKSQVKISSKFILIGLIHIYSSIPKVMFTGVCYIYLANVLDNKEAHISYIVSYSLVILLSFLCSKYHL